MPPEKNKGLKILDKILSKADELFLRYGVKSITMDDLCQELGMSKKTLYQNVDGKTDLVNKVMSIHLNYEKNCIVKIVGDAKDAIDEMASIGRHVVEHLGKINPSVIYDLKKHYPRAYGQLEEYRKTFIYTTILNNLNRGIKEGLYRGELQADLIARIYTAQAECLLDPEYFPPKQYAYNEVFSEYLKYHIRGIATPKGVESLDKQNIN